MSSKPHRAGHQRLPAANPVADQLGLALREYLDFRQDQHFKPVQQFPRQAKLGDALHGASGEGSQLQGAEHRIAKVDGPLLGGQFRLGRAAVEHHRARDRLDPFKQAVHLAQRRANSPWRHRTSGANPWPFSTPLIIGSSPTKKTRVF